jgi:hypothetical protein
MRISLRSLGRNQDLLPAGCNVHVAPAKETVSQRHLALVVAH